MRRLRAGAGNARHPGKSSMSWRALLDAEIDGLPPESKAALIACYLEDRGPREAAAMLGWSRRRVCTRLLLGRRLLLHRLGKKGVELSASSLRQLLREEAKSEGMSARIQSQAVLRATSGAARLAWSRRLTDLVHTALRMVDRWMDKRSQ